MGKLLIALDVMLWAGVLVYALMGNVFAMKALLVLLTIAALVCMHRATVNKVKIQGILDALYRFSNKV